MRLIPIPFLPEAPERFGGVALLIHGTNGKRRSEIVRGKVRGVHSVWGSVSPHDRDAFLDSKLRLIQFAVVDPDTVSERAQDMLKKEIFRRYNSGITPLRQVEVDRAIYIADEPTQFIKEKLRNNPSLYEMFASLFLTGGKEIHESNPTNLEKALQEVRFLLVCAQMPILSTRKKESLQRF